MQTPYLLGCLFSVSTFRRRERLLSHATTFLLVELLLSCIIIL